MVFVGMSNNNILYPDLYEVTFKMNNYYFNNANQFCISNYNKQKAFSSFLPGIAGAHGIPMWCFYVNRGQCVTSFGIRNKDNAIMEFRSANKAYQQTELLGFRTFIKIEDKNGFVVYEPFKSNADYTETQKMKIGMNSIEIESISERYGISTKVRYFTIPNENFAALVRMVVITNVSNDSRNIEVLDGMPELIPYGVQNSAYKEMSTTLSSWMDVENIRNKVPYYKVRTSTEDSAKVSKVNGGYFSFSFDGENGGLLTAFVDPYVIFGQNTGFAYPDVFAQKSMDKLLDEEQIPINKAPCFFAGTAKRLNSGQELFINSVIGFTENIENINSQISSLAQTDYLQSKYKQADLLTHEISDMARTKTALPEFDNYCRQNYLDNILRGGYPTIIGEKNPSVFYLYSRKHGDLERDYNAFYVADEYFSQGNGNYRDVNQNRRSDVLLNPSVGDYNIRLFMNLIQTDGYNPLVVRGNKYRLKQNGKETIYRIFKRGKVSENAFFQKAFSPGMLWDFLKNNLENTNVAINDAFNTIIDNSEQEALADHGEGYWIDHWTYNMDLIENYLAIFPDKKSNLLFGEKIYRYYDNTHVVVSRAEKYVLSEGKVRQYDSVNMDEDKAKLISSREHNRYWMRDKYGLGEVYHTHLFEKLLVLAVNKFSNLDPFGIGIEMEANKPGWNDALNGLPGIFGSGVGEMLDLKRLLQFIIKVCEDNENKKIRVAIEIVDFMVRLSECLNMHRNDERESIAYWNKSGEIKEKYRLLSKTGYSGEVIEIQSSLISEMLSDYLMKVNDGIQAAKELGNGLMPSFITYEVIEYKTIKDAENEYIKPKRFRARVLPLFMEAIMKSMKEIDNKGDAVKLYRNIKKSDIYDRKLKMYKTSESIANESIEIGRLKAFTPGWLENESVFMHMEYKYLLALLKAGLYDEFFEDMRTCMPPFLNPEMYGRSTIENSSFIASSANPDKRVHGRGYVARLSGTTAEFLSIWNVMMLGKEPFYIKDGSLIFSLQPVLPGWLFDENNEVSFTLFGNCNVVYKNESGEDTFGKGKAEVYKSAVTYKNGEIKQFDKGIIRGDYAERIRNKEACGIIVYLK